MKTEQSQVLPEKSERNRTYQPTNNFVKMTLNQETEQKSNFVITSSYKTFNDKQKDLFKQLDYAEKCNKDIIPKSDVMEHDSNSFDRGSSSSHRKVASQFNGKESIFRKPQVLPPRRTHKRKIVPDFQKNPSKWTKYSLDDVDDMSDRSNTAAAFAFLKEIEQRKEAEQNQAMDTDDVSVDPNKIVFKKVIKKLEPPEPQSSGAAFINSKWQMQEYVVGRKVKKASKQKNVAAKNTSNKITLDHLNEDE